MSKENENKKQYESIPGSSKDPNIEGNESIVNGDQENNGIELENNQIIIKTSENETKNKYTSFEYVPLNAGASSRIKKVEAFVYMRLPPDGGYAWIVLITSFLCVVNIDGMRLSVGRVMPAISTDMGFNYEQAALIASLQIAFYYFCGPFACALIHKIGYRAVSIIGACLSIFGTIVGSISTNFLSVIIFFGVTAGIGYGMISIATQIIIGFYFEKYRPIATGIYSAGSGFGLLIFSPLYNYIIIHYGWRNALRCHAFFAFIVLILSIFYRPVKPTRIGQYVEKKSNEDDTETYDSAESLEISSAYFQNYGSSNSNLSVVSKATKPKANKIPSTPELPKAKKTKNKYISCIPKCFKRKHKSTVSSEYKHISVNPMDRQDIFYVGKPDYQDPVPKTDKDIIFLTTPVHKVKSIHYTMSVTKPRKDKQELDYKPKHKLFNLISSTFKLLIDPNLLQTKAFQYLVTSSFLYTLGTHVPYLYITEHVDIPQFYANYLLSSIGFANIIFRISGGFLAYSMETNPVYLAGIPMAFSGIFTILSGFFGRSMIWYQFLYTIILGCGFAFSASLKSIIFVQLLGLDKLTNATGLTALAMGIASFMGTNLAGLIKGTTGNTNYAFAFSGIALFLGGIVYILLPELVGKSNDPKITKSSNPN